MTEIGHVGNKLIIKTDQESSIKAVAEKVAAERADAQTIIEHSPVRSSGSNGIIERGIKEFEYHVRSMKSALDERLGSSILADSNILPWMIEFSSVLINRYLVGKDGKTAYERLKGKSSKMLGFEFAEMVHFRRIPLPGRLGKLESLWMTGLLIGYKASTGEYMVANDEGAFRTRNLLRKPFEERWDRKAVEDIKYTPWRVKDPNPKRNAPETRDRHEPSIDIQVDTTIDAGLPAPAAAEQIPRRVYLTKSLLGKYGMTDGCVGCTNATIGNTGVVHSEECRKRIEKAMRQDAGDRERVREAHKRRTDFVNKHMPERSEKESRMTEEARDTPTEAGGDPGRGSASSSARPGTALPVIYDRTQVADKRKREDGDEGDEERLLRDLDPALGIMDMMCDDPNEYFMGILEDDLEKYHEAELEDEYSKKRNWADLTEEQFQEEEVYDEMTGKPLNYEKVWEARSNELEALGKMGVWRIVPVSECLKATGKKPIKGRWVDVNKGDDTNDNYRSRYVARELRQAHGGAQREGLFAAMPPLEALKIVISRVVSGKHQDKRTIHKLLFMDISKAYLHADVIDDCLYVELPTEMNMPGYCGHLKKALYGTREAARCWEREYSKTLESMGFMKGASSPCLFRHRERDCSIFIHGDDFVVSGCQEHLEEVQEAICKASSRR